MVKAFETLVWRRSSRMACSYGRVILSGFIN